MTELAGLKIAVVANDAGAANHIIAWLNSGIIPADNLTCYFQGPAKVLLPDAFDRFQCSTLTETLGDIDVLISGTGWQTNLEYDARKLVAETGVRSIAVIDHWTNYRERFIRRELEILPERIWVTDDYAYQMAAEIFPSLDVECKQNDYLENVVTQIRRVSLANANQESPLVEKANVLFLMEPIRSVWGDSRLPGEIQAFEYFIGSLHKIWPNKNVEVTIRPHPSDQEGKYRELIAKFSYLMVSIDNSVSLSDAIGYSDVVVGCQTYAMVLALAAGKKVFSANPPNAPACILPHQGIIALSASV